MQQAVQRGDRRGVPQSTAPLISGHARKPVSSYFPEAEEEPSEADHKQDLRASYSPLRPRAGEQQPVALSPTHNHLSFPRSRAVLWDRQALSFPFFIRCRDACPALVLRRSIIADIVRVMKSSQKRTKYLGRCTSLKATPEHSVLSNSPLRLIESAYALVLEPLSTLEHATPAAGKANRLLVDVCADADDINPDLRTMVNSVLQGMKRPGLFSLASYVAVRATIQAAPSKSGIAVFEAVLPNIDLRLTRIHPIAFLGTSLANQLMGGPTRTGRTGYLTLNETRKLVPILETDPMLVSIPLVGVWVSDASVELGEDGASNLAHPTIWAACIRYLFCGDFKDKASVDDQTFLLVVVGSAGLRYYEVQGTLKTATSAIDHDDPEGSACLISLKHPPATVACVCLDFTVDLPIVEDNPQDSPASSIIARFRPQANVQRIGAFREVIEPLLRNSREDVPLYRVRLQQRDLARSDFPQSPKDRQMDQPEFKREQPEHIRQEGLSADDGHTPVPRVVQPQPSPTTPRTEFVQRASVQRSTITKTAVTEAVTAATTTSSSAPIPAVLSSMSGIDGSIPLAAAAIIASQQEQLVLMQMKLQELQEQLAAMQHDQSHNTRQPTPKSAAKHPNIETQRMAESAEHVGDDVRRSSQRTRGQDFASERRVHSNEDGSIELQPTEDLPEDMDPSESAEISVLDETFVTNIGGHDISSLHLPTMAKSPTRSSATSSTSPTPSRGSRERSPPRPPHQSTASAIPRISGSETVVGALPWAFDIPRIQMAPAYDMSTFLESPTLAQLEAKYLNDNSEMLAQAVPQPRRTNSPPPPNIAPSDERLLHSVIRELPKL